MAKAPTTSEDTDTKAAKRAVRKREPDFVIFESRDKEPRQFNVAGVQSTRNFGNGRIEFKVPRADVERFEQHFHVQRQRIVRKAE